MYITLAQTIKLYAAKCSLLKKKKKRHVSLRQYDRHRILMEIATMLVKRWNTFPKHPETDITRVVAKSLHEKSAHKLHKHKCRKLVALILNTERERSVR